MHFSIVSDYFLLLLYKLEICQLFRKKENINNHYYLCLFSYRHNKDVALINLANVLHRAHFSADAAIVVHAALDYSDVFTSYYTLGNIYAVNKTLILVLLNNHIALFYSYQLFRLKLDHLYPIREEE